MTKKKTSKKTEEPNQAPETGVPVISTEAERRKNREFFTRKYGLFRGAFSIGK